MTDNEYTAEEWLAAMRALGVNPGVVDDRTAPLAAALNAVLPLYRDRIRDQAYRDGESNREADFALAYEIGGPEGMVALMRDLGWDG